MKKMHIVAAAVIIAIAGSAVWFQKQISKPGATSEQKTLRIAMVPWIGDGAFFVARDKGFFQEEKVNVELIDVSDTATAKQLLQTGQVDMLYLTSETVVVLQDAGVKVKIVGANDLSFGADGIVAIDAIKTIEELRGKTVAFEVGSPSHFLISYLLNQKNLTTKDLTVVNSIAPDAGVAFVAGKVDAAVTWEPWLTKAVERAGGHVLVNSKDVPIMYDMSIIRQDIAEKYPEEIKAMFRALFTSQAWISEHPAEAANVIAAALKITPTEAAEQMLGVRWFTYGESKNNLVNGEYSVKASLQSAADLWFKLGLIKNPMNVNDLIDPSIMNNLYHDTRNQEQS